MTQLPEKVDGILVSEHTRSCDIFWRYLRVVLWWISLSPHEPKVHLLEPKKPKPIFDSDIKIDMTFKMSLTIINQHCCNLLFINPT